jgi:Cu+-exporting ATPase
VVLMRPRPMLVPAALDIATATAAVIRQNLAFAFVYNVALLPAAALGALDPALAGAAMAASSLSVVGNALRLKRWRPAGEAG